MIFSQPSAVGQDENFDVELKSTETGEPHPNRMPATQTPTLSMHDEASPTIRNFKPRAKIPEINQEKMNVTTYKTSIVEDTHDIQLLFPPHNSTLTPGVVKFQWLVGPNAVKKERGRGLKALEISDLRPKLKINLILEKINSQSKHLIKTQNLESYVSCDPGTYRWRVVGANGKVESRWRMFKIIQLKYRGTASTIPKVLPQKMNRVDDEDIPSIPNTNTKTKRKPLTPMSEY